MREASKSREEKTRARSGCAISRWIARAIDSSELLHAHEGDGSIVASITRSAR